MTAPAVSVVLVSDYKAGEEQGWKDRQETLAALAEQDFDEPAEILLVEEERLRDFFPEGLLLRSNAGLRVCFSPSSSSFGLKNAGVEAASAPLVAVLDADCKPGTGWLRALVSAARAHPEAAAVSGRTRYQGGSAMERIFGLLDRSYADPGRFGPTRFVANNNVIYRRDVYLAHPLPPNAGPFSARMQSEALLRDGFALLFEPEAEVVHGFEGWKMMADIRRNAGFGTVMTRRLDRKQPYAGLVRLGLLSIPVFAAGKTWESWVDCFRCAPAFGVRWWEMPAAIALSVLLHLMEIPGMAAALSDRAIGETAYR